MAAPLTEDEELELEMEQARARGAQKQPADGLGAGAREFGRSVGEGATGLLDLPSRAWTGLKNLPGRLTSTAGDAASAYAPGVDPEAFAANAPAPVKLEDPNTYFNTTYNAANPPNPNFPTVRRAGNVVGAGLPAVVTAGLAGGFGALPLATADVAATTGLQFGAGQGARKVAELTGGDPDKAEEGVSTLASFVTPSFRNALETYNRNRQFDAQSPARVAEADRARVPIDVSLVGSDRAAAIGPLDPTIRARQQTAIDASLKAAADARRGAPATGPISRGDVGSQVVDVAQGGSRAAGQQANAIFDPLSESVGRGTVLDDAPLQTKLDQLRAPGTSATVAPTVDYFQGLLDKDRANAGPTWQQVLTQRSVGNKPLDNAVSFDRNTRADIKTGQSDVLRNAAAGVGYAPEDFDAINRSYGQTRSAQKQLDKISRPSLTAGPGEETPPAAAYSRMFGPAGEQNSPLLEQVRQYADPNGLGSLLANNFELRARGPVAAGRPELPQDVGVNPKAPDWWMSLPEQTRMEYSANPEVRDQIDATMNVLRADARRSGVAPPTGIDPTTALSIGGAIATGNPAVAAGLLPKVGAYLNRRNLRDEDYLRTVIGGGSTATPGWDLARLLSGAVQTGR